MKLSDEPLVPAERIAECVAQLAAIVSRDYAEREVVLMPVLKGGIHFASDLMRRLTIPATVDFIRARSYQGARSSGSVEFLVAPSMPLAGKHVLVIEDILDTGRTTAAILDRLQSEGPASVALCVFLDKPAHRQIDVRADYTGLVIGDHFVVGYGLDYEERFRELPAVYIVEPH